MANPELVPQLQENLKGYTAGSPVEPDELWTNRSSRELADELCEQGFAVAPHTVLNILRNELQLGRRQIAKKLTMDESADRDAQFQILQQYKQEFLEQGFPVLSIDTKKEELLGNFSVEARRGRMPTCVRGTMISPATAGAK